MKFSSPIFIIGVSIFIVSFTISSVLTLNDRTNSLRNDITLQQDKLTALEEKVNDYNRDNVLLSHVKERVEKCFLLQDIYDTIKDCVESYIDNYTLTIDEVERMYSHDNCAIGYMNQGNCSRKSFNECMSYASDATYNGCLDNAIYIGERKEKAYNLIR